MTTNSIIRDSTLDDAQRIFDLRCDPRLKSMQYAPSIFETPKSLLAIARPGSEIPTNGWKCSTILTDGQFAGHIIEGFRTGANGATQILLGWNLVPDYWGMGIMVRSLSLLFEQRFAAKQDIKFVACCFESNRRCSRVMEKLGFRPDNLRLSERAFHFVRTCGRERVVKYCLTHDVWQNHSSKLKASICGEHWNQ